MRPESPRNSSVVSQQMRDELRRQLAIVERKKQTNADTQVLLARQKAKHLATLTVHDFLKCIAVIGQPADTLTDQANAYFQEPEKRLFLKNPKKEALRQEFQAATEAWLLLHREVFFPEKIEEQTQLEAQYEQLAQQLATK